MTENNVVQMPPRERGVISVANYFIERAASEDLPVTQLKLLKLVYIAYGWYLVLKNDKLYPQPIEAWSHGPVVRELYDSIKHHGRSPIESPIEEFNLETSEFSTPRLSQEADEDLDLILDRVWGAYSRYSASQLRNKTHEDGTPWTETWSAGKGYSCVIPDALIYRHFDEKIRVYLDGVK